MWCPKLFYPSQFRISDSGVGPYHGTLPTDDSILDSIPQRETLENLGVTPLSRR